MEPLRYNGLNVSRGNQLTGFSYQSLSLRYIGHTEESKADSEKHRSITASYQLITLQKVLKRSVRVISTARLNGSHRVHLQPIDVIVFDYPDWNSYLVASFALRCFQRLSVPDLDTRRCSWRNSRYASGQSDTVLSY